MNPLQRSFNTFTERLNDLIIQFRSLHSERVKYCKILKLSKFAATIIAATGAVTSMYALYTNKNAVFTTSITGFIAGCFSIFIIFAVDQSKLRRHVKAMNILFKEFEIEVMAMKPVINHVVEIVIDSNNTGACDQLIPLDGRYLLSYIANARQEIASVLSDMENIFNMLPKIENSLKESTSTGKATKPIVPLYIEAFIQVAEFIQLARNFYNDKIDIPEEIIMKLERIKVIFHDVNLQWISATTAKTK